MRDRKTEYRTRSDLGESGIASVLVAGGSRALDQISVHHERNDRDEKRKVIQTCDYRRRESKENYYSTYYLKQLCWMLEFIVALWYARRWFVPSRERTIGDGIRKKELCHIARLRIVATYIRGT